MAIIDISIGATRPKGENSLPSAKTIVKEILDTYSFKYVESPMSITLEGDIDEAFEMIRKIQLKLKDMGYPRTFSQIKIDDRHDKKGSIDQKLSSVTSKL
jgi:uncharacterized protein (TIGR00106 family)